MRFLGAILLLAGLAGCAHSTAETRASSTAESSSVVEAIVARWIREAGDKKIARYVAPEYLNLPIVAHLKTHGFIIESNQEPRPPRNSWDTDESVTWVELAIQFTEISGDKALARISTRWNAGSQATQYALTKMGGRWMVDAAR